MKAWEARSRKNPSGPRSRRRRCITSASPWPSWSQKARRSPRTLPRKSRSSTAICPPRSVSRGRRARARRSCTRTFPATSPSNTRRAALKTRLTVRSQRLVGNPIEPRAFLASFDAGSGVFTVYSPSQGLNGMRGFLAAATGLPGERIRVVTELVGGSFGIRSYSYAEHVAVMLAAQKLGRPVKGVATRSEIFLSDNHGRGLTLTGELALARDGAFLALRFEDGADLGAFSTPFGPQIGSRNITITMGGVYRIPAMHAHTRCAYSNANRK